MAQLPGLQWAKNIGGAKGNNITVDAAGNVYTTGYFGGVADFDPGPGTFYLTADGGDAYVSKLDGNGDFVWALQLGGDQSNYGRSVCVDVSGNVYVAGYFSGTVDFDPGPSTFNITSNGQYDIFITKLDANGNFIWAKNIGGASSDLAYAAVLDLSGNICITGVFIGAVDFDPGAGTFTMNGGGNNDCFILRLDANGDFLQALQVAGNYSEGDAIAVDAAGNLYVCGNYNATADLDPGAGVFNVTASSGADAFVIKLNSAGSFVWGKSFGGFGTDNVKAVKADAAGNVYLAGDFPFTVDFDPGPGVYNLTTAGSIDAFVLKLNSTGDFAWAKAFAGPNAEAAKDLALDASGNAYITGIFQGTADFDPGAGVYNLTVVGGVNNDIFISKLNTSGDLVWALNFGGNMDDEGLSVFCGVTGNVYATGDFDGGAVDFDPGAGITTLLNSAGPTFIVNLNGNVVLPLTLVNFSGEATLKGNALKWATAQETNTNHFDIEWSNDGLAFIKMSVQPAAGYSSSVRQYHYVHTQPTAGVNYYRLKIVDADERFIYSPVIKLNSSFTKPAFTIFPNPVADKMNLYINALKNETLPFYLYNTEGKLMSTRYFNLIKGSNIFTWNFKTLAPGRYVISSGKNQFKPVSIVKQ
ncbi:MAG: SBBP repeat-containing protein [Ferruginibacter sp.]